MNNYDKLKQYIIPYKTFNFVVVFRLNRIGQKNYIHMYA